MAIATEKPPGDLAGLVQTHQAGVWRYLRYLGADETQADDLTQDVFLAVFRKPLVEHSPAATAAYLRTVARNLFLMSARSRSEIARELEMTEDGVKSLLRRTRGVLRRCVEGKMGE